MFEKFTKDARWIVERSVEEAQGRGDRTVEAEHLLFALAGVDPTLRAAGLDREGVARALDVAFERSLAAVGVSVGDPGPATGAARPHRSPRFGTTAKRALELSLRVALERGDRRITRGHVLLGLLQVQEGTVARALAAADVDRRELADRFAANLDG